jgi:TatD DNase family protein
LNPRTPESFLIDTHCHLEMEAFTPDREEVIRRAVDVGIEAIITIGSDLAGNRGGLELSQKYDFIYSSVGFHPHDAKDFTEEIFSQIKEWANKYKFNKPNPPSPPFAKVGNNVGALSKGEQESSAGKVVAIGEIGLDYHYDNSPREVQRKVFVQQIQLAEELDLPVIIHSREAAKDTLEIITRSGVNRGVFHCFSGDMAMAEQVMALGFYISVAGPVTFKHAKKLKEIAQAIPDDYLLIETDAPYLTPEPFRGRRNEPAYLVHTAQTVAALRNVSLQDISRITTLNAKRLFRIGEMPDKGKIAYRIRDSLYLNITNQCTNECSFCIRFQSDYVKGHNLRLANEPTEDELKDAIGDPTRYQEIVFCGYGEPLLRLDVVRNVGQWVRQKKGRVRIDTNGHGNMIHGRNILPELQGIVDSMSISLNAQSKEMYDAICKPSLKNAYEGVLSFIREAKKVIPHVQVTVVALPGVDIEECRRIAGALGVQLRVRELDVVG